jgi:hypothetical protein
MVVGMLKSKWILHLCQRCFYSGLNMTLECKDTKFGLFVGASQSLYLERQNE